MARLLLDENMPRSAGRLLAAQGHDVEFIADLAPSVDDRGALALSRERGRILVTLDADFGELIFRHGVQPPVAVVYVRIHPVSGQAIAAAAATALAGDVTGQFIVAATDAVRRRALPAAETGRGGS